MNTPNISTSQPRLKINAYGCSMCAGVTGTAELDEGGVTPYMIRCRATPGCTGMAKSSMYRVPQDVRHVQYVWYKPHPTTSTYMRDETYYKQGGMALAHPPAPVTEEELRDIIAQLQKPEPARPRLCYTLQPPRRVGKSINLGPSGSAYNRIRTNPHIAALMRPRNLGGRKGRGS